MLIKNETFNNEFQTAKHLYEFSKNNTDALFIIHRVLNMTKHQYFAIIRETINLVKIK